MTTTRIFNDFKRRFLAGEVADHFSCSAYLMNSAYEASFPHVMYYRTIGDFEKINSGALHYTNFGLAGSAIANEMQYRNTYYRDTALQAEDAANGTLIVVTEENLDSYSYLLLDKHGNLPEKYKAYLKKYTQFFLVGRADEFSRLVKYCKDNKLETFVVVLYDDVENVVIENSCFGNSQKHPFRGIFDGNGYAIYVTSIALNGEYACGLFGYIAETAVVKNLKIFAQPTDVSKYSIAEYIDNITVTVNNSDQLISLKTIKDGCNDVCIGILAGVNHGSIENVVVSADVMYASKIRPDVYLIQNKANELEDNHKKLISTSIINAKIANKFDGTTALSSFDNFCYPTQLCLNSSANMVPYVGYFNEGAFNTCTVDPNATKAPLYRAQTTGQYYPSAWYHKNRNISPGEGLKIEQFESKCSYMHDIVNYYIQKKHPNDEGDADKYYRRENFGLAGITNSVYSDPKDDTEYAVPESAKIPFSFRLGPNSKQAFLIGGLVGYNNGDLTNVSTVETMQFDKNIVALVGGIAGRGNRGTLSGVHARTVYSGSSGMYTDYILVNNNAPPDSTTFVRAPLTTLREHTFSSCSVSFGDEYGQVTELTGAEIKVPIFTANATIAFSGETEPYATLYSREAVGEQYTKKYDFYGTMSDDYANIFIPYKEFEISARVPGSFVSAFKVQVTGASLVGDCHACVDEQRRVSLLQTQYDYSACKIEGGLPVVITDPDTSGTEKIVYAQLNLYLKCSATYNEHPTTAEIVIPHSAFNGGFPCTITNMNTLLADFYQYSKDIKVDLPPVFNIGGMFGEYIYANAQEISDATVYAGFKGFIPSGDVTVSAKNSMTHTNKLANFACNMTIDSVNKTDAKMYDGDYEIASADGRVQNNLRCKVLTLLDDSSSDVSNYTKWNTETTTLDYLNNASAMFAFYLNCYNQIAPAFVSTHYCDNLHRKGETHYAILGIQYEDQLFFKYGLNMGDVYQSYTGNGDRYKYAQMLASSASENSGVYFNYPAQLSSYDYHDTPSNYNRGMCDFHTVLTSAYDFIDGDSSTATCTSYITTQIEYYPQHYPLYRGKASFEYSKHALTFATSAYIPITYKVNTSSVHASALSDAANAMIDVLDDLQPSASSPNYIYTYSAKDIYLGPIKPIACEMIFSDEFATFIKYSEYPQIMEKESEEASAMSALIDAQKYNKAYILSSDSYMNTYLDNPASFINMATVTANEIGMPASAEPNAMTPASRVVVSGATVVNSDHFVLNTPFEVQERIAPHYFGFSYIYKKLSSLSDLNMGVSHVKRMLVNTASPDNIMCVPYHNNKIGYNTTTQAFVVNSPILIDESYTAFDNLPEPKSNFVCADDVLYITYEVFATSSYTVSGIPQQTRVSEKYLMSAKIIDSTPDFDRNTFMDANEPVTSNALVYGYIPPSANIVAALNRAAYTTLNCTGISANDLQYMLLVDKDNRPILDVKLDTTAVDNAGYIVKFDRAGLIQSLEELPDDEVSAAFITSGGLAINIENGNA